MLDRAEVSREMELGSGSDHVPATAISQERAGRDGGKKDPPGPACSKGGRGTRSRDGSTSSAPSRSSGDSATVAAQRRSSREAAREANRLAVTKASEQGDNQRAPIYIDSEEFEGDLSYTEEKGILPPRKRKRGRGRPQTTGEDVGRALTIEEENKMKRERAELDRESTIRSTTTPEVLSNIDRAVEDVCEELEHASSEDVAQRARQSMAEVLQIAKSSKNLKGTTGKILRTAAVVGSASAEVLKRRADREVSEDHVLQELRAMRKELEHLKRELTAAKEETEREKSVSGKLREELMKSRRRKKTGRRERAVIEDSPPSSLDRKRDSTAETEYASTVEMEVDDPPTFNEEDKKAEPGPLGAVPGPSGAATGPAETNVDPPEYDDERRKAEILPPPEKWPPVILPPLKGRVTILEDAPLQGVRVRVVPDNRIASGKSQPSDGGPGACEAQTLVNALMPMMTEWLKNSLSALGVTGAASETGKRNARPGGRKDEGGKKHGSNAPRPAPIKTGNAKEGLRSTTVPNKKLWSEVAGGGSGGNAPSILPVEAKKGPSEQQRGTPGATPQGREEWRVVETKKKKKAKRTPLTETKALTPKGGPKEPEASVSRAKARSTAAKPAPNKMEVGKKQVDPVKKPPRRRPPRTAAVTLTCPPDSYAEAMRVARQKVNLRDIGIQALRPKRAATGAIILEVPGPDGADKAAVLRDKMEEALREMEGVRVARPVKTGDLRIKNIIDSTTVEEIKEEIARLGRCKTEEVRTGEIRPAPNGLGTLWLQCPLAAANRAAAVGKLELVWSSPSVEALEPRATRCFRCLERGHIQATCPNTTERRNLCYRCSQEGHLARECNSAPRCAICEGSGRPSAHKMGGKSCKAPGRKAGPPRVEKSPTSQPMDVDTEETLPAVRGEPTQKGGAPVPERRGKTKKEHRPAVRGGLKHPGGGRVPVPVRPVQNEEMDVEVEVELPPAVALLPKEDISAREVPDGGTSVTAAPSPQC